MEKAKQNIIIICGPTASGKTSLALRIAKELPKVNILSVDSRQAYKGLDVITGKDIPSDLPESVRFFGLDLFRPDERANVADFLRYSQTVIEQSRKENVPLIIVGGTGMYLKAITENLSDILVPPNPKLRKQLEKMSLPELQNKLSQIDNKKYSSLNHSDINNPRRLIRYLEIASSSQETNTKNIQKRNIMFHWYGLLPGKDILRTGIHKRVIDRLNSGAINEVKELLNRYSNRYLPIFTSLGVSQIISFLDGKISKDQLIDLWTNAEVDYARRQIVWFKKQPGIVWYDRDIDRQTLSKKLAKIYTNNA